MQPYNFFKFHFTLKVILNSFVKYSLRKKARARYRKIAHPSYQGNQ